MATMLPSHGANLWVFAMAKASLGGCGKTCWPALDLFSKVQYPPTYIFEVADNDSLWDTLGTVMIYNPLGNICHYPCVFEVL